MMHLPCASGILVRASPMELPTGGSFLGSRLLRRFFGQTGALKQLTRDHEDRHPKRLPSRSWANTRFVNVPTASRIEDDDENEYDLAGNMLGHSSRCQQFFKTRFPDLHEIIGRFDNTPDGLVSGLAVQIRLLQKR